MGAFSSVKTIPIAVSDLAPVANDVVQHFQEQGYETTSARTIGGWHVSITKRGMFKSVIGTKTALNIEIEPGTNQTNVRASVGIFGMQAIPAAISLFLFWPVLITQIVGMIRQAQLDDEAIACIENSLKIHGAAALPAVSSTGRFCVQCGAANASDSTICAKCGAALPTLGPSARSQL